jgi:hypothetical protein
MTVTTSDNSLDGLSALSIAKAQKAVGNLTSWEEAAAHATRWIKELRQSLRVFQEKIERGEPWPGNSDAKTEV